jgi:hypothetical protein
MVAENKQRQEQAVRGWTSVSVWTSARAGKGKERRERGVREKEKTFFGHVDRDDSEELAQTHPDREDEATLAFISPAPAHWSRSRHIGKPLRASEPEALKNSCMLRLWPFQLQMQNSAQCSKSQPYVLSHTML